MPPVTTPAVSDENFFEKIWDGIKSIFSKGGIFLKMITSAADTYVNAFKNLEQSQIGQFLESAVEGIDPALTPAITLVHNALPKILTDLNLAMTAENLAPADIVNQGLAAINVLKTADPALYAGTLNTINAKVQTIIGDKVGVVIPIAQALLASPAVHNPSFANIVGTVENVVNIAAPNSEVAKIVTEAAPVVEAITPEVVSEAEPAVEAPVVTPETPPGNG